MEFLFYKKHLQTEAALGILYLFDKNCKEVIPTWLRLQKIPSSAIFWISRLTPPQFFYLLACIAWAARPHVERLWSKPAWCTARLHAIATQVPLGAKLADVGTDHGYLPVWLLVHGRIDKAVAADLREGPLGRARETARQHRQEGKISFRLCDGLTGIAADEADTVIIAGMGGNLRNFRGRALDATG